MAIRNLETAKQNAAHWAKIALAPGGVTPWEWARRVAMGEAKLADVPRQYAASIAEYWKILESRKSLL